MGITYVTGTVSANDRESTVTFLVDSGSQYSLLPHDVWSALNLVAQRSQQFSLADGTVIERHLSECYLVLPQGHGHTPVILGEPGDDQPLLGALTLETFALMLNPFSRELQPMRLLLPSIRA